MPATLISLETDPQVAIILGYLQTEPFVAVDDSRVEPSIDYLISVDLLAPERKAAVMSYPRPEPFVP